MNTYVIISSVLAGIITWIMMYIDARLFDTPKTKFTYVKGISFVTLLVGTIVYFMGEGVGVQIGGSSSAVAGPVSSNMLPPISSLGADDMLTGLPPF